METSYMKKKPNKSIGLSASPYVLSEKTTQRFDCKKGGLGDGRMEDVSPHNCCSINDICYLHDSNSDNAEDEQIIVVSLSSMTINQQNKQQNVSQPTDPNEKLEETKQCVDINGVNSLEAFDVKCLKSSVRKVNAILTTTTNTKIASTSSFHIVNSPLSYNHPSHESIKPAITTLKDVQHSQLQQHHQHPTTNNINASSTKQQYPFLKSQSLDIVGNKQQTSLIYEMHHNLLLQLTEDRHQGKPITVTQSLENEDAKKSLSKKKPIASTQSQNSYDLSSKLPILESRPIYPNIPYSPYASPRSNRRRPPLRESRRISIEKSGSFLQLNQYKLMDQIGQGSYGLVKLAYSEEDSTHYAMKILSKRRLLRQAGLTRGPKKQSMSPLDRVYREIAVLKKLHHPNVIKLIEVLDDPMEDSLYMVFEWVQKGEVLRIPTNEPLSEARACSVFRDTLLGLEYLHYQRIVHADLKPSNLLLTDSDHVKIADLGVCNEFLGEDAKMSNGSMAGTPAFRAPETLQLGHYVYCGKAADIWALGVTLYSLVYGVVPFPVTTVPVLYENIKRHPIEFPERPKISDSLRNCILRMLTKDPVERITLPQLKEHPWVSSNGSAPLPSEDENCRLVEINDEDMNSVVRSIPKLDTLILIKTMLKKHSFGNPFMKGSSGGISVRAPQRGGSRLERFVRAGRSNSAPGAYTNPMDRQYSADNLLPSLCEYNTSTENT